MILACKKKLDKLTYKSGTWLDPSAPFGNFLERSREECESKMFKFETQERKKQAIFNCETLRISNILIILEFHQINSYN